MKYKIVLPMLTAIVIFAATTVAEAGIFGRLSVVWNGCNPCEPVAAQPCEPVACNPCEALASDGCYDACVGTARSGRPLGGLLTNLKARLAAGRCAPVDCNPCEEVAALCNPCEPIACDPCDAVTVACSPRAPFAGFLQNLRAKLTLPKRGCGGCNVGCDPCGAVVEPCGACR